MKIIRGAAIALTVAAWSLPGLCATPTLSVNVELIGRGITGLTMTAIAPGVSCAPAAGFSSCLTVPGGSAANMPFATVVPVTVPKGQAITSVTMAGADAVKFALSSGCNPYVAPCTLSIGAAVLPVSSLDSSGNPIPYQITLTVTAP
jgi:hypothetical protein